MYVSGDIFSNVLSLVGRKHLFFLIISDEKNDKIKRYKSKKKMK